MYVETPDQKLILTPVQRPQLTLTLVQRPAVDGVQRPAAAKINLV